MEETLDLLAQALSSTVNILDIRPIVLGGGVGLQVKVAELGEHSLLLGTVALCRERLGG